MNSELLIDKIDKMIDASDDSLVRDTIKYVNIKSVASPAMAEPGAPFGVGVRAVLDEFMHDCQDIGLYIEDHGVGVVSAAMSDGVRDLGIWLHGDVVAEGDGWTFEPYNAVEYKGCVIGRGTTDNKGQLCAILNLFKIFKVLGCNFKYNPAIYLGSNEENGMCDLLGVEGNPEALGFLNVCTPPRLSLVPDSGFPVGYGGKGGMSIVLKSRFPLDGFTFTAGQPDSRGTATATFPVDKIPDSLSNCGVRKNGASADIYTFSPPRHGAHPDPNGNMITALSRVIIDNGLATGHSLRAVTLIHDLSLDVHGEMLGIATRHEIMGELTVFTGLVNCNDACPEVTLNIRYPLGITYEEIVEKIDSYANSVGFYVTSHKWTTKPYMLDTASPVLKMLHEVASSVTGEDKPPFTLSGGTYAHHLPNAYVFGMSGCKPPEDFPKGHGSAHGVDELVSIDRLKRAMKIYARAMFRLDAMDW